MGVFLLVVSLFLSGAIATFSGGFVAALLFLLITSGPTMLLAPGLLLAAWGAFLVLKLATLPAFILGGLLWWARVRSKWAWAGTGAMAGAALYAFARAFPGAIDPLSAQISADRSWPIILLIVVIGGATTALVFRVIMQALTSFDEGLRLD